MVSACCWEMRTISCSGGDGDRLAAGVLDHAVGLDLGVVQKALALAHDLAGLGELRREQIANLVHDVEGGGDIDLAKVVLAEDRLRVLQEDREFFEQPKYSGFVHVVPS